MTRENICRMAFAVLLATALLSTQSWAQDDDKNFTVGEKVEYKEGYAPREVWSEGAIVKLDPQYKGVIIRSLAGVSTFFKTTDVRHIQTHPANDNPPIKPQKDPPQPEGAGAGMMTKEEIMGIIRSSPRANTDREFCKDLIEQIKRRGVKEQFSQKTDNLRPLIDSKCWYQATDTNVYDAIDYNLGPPVTLSWLAGTWKMSVIGATVDTAPGNGYIYRQNEAYGKLGLLTIDGSGTYSWKVYPTDPPAKYVHGAWRKATKEELGMRGGDGIVLKNGVDGEDWIVFKSLNEPHPGNNIEVRSIQSGVGKRSFGSRT